MSENIRIKQLIENIYKLTRESMFIIRDASYDGKLKNENHLSEDLRNIKNMAMEVKKTLLNIEENESVEIPEIYYNEITNFIKIIDKTSILLLKKKYSNAEDKIISGLNLFGVGFFRSINEVVTTLPSVPKEENLLLIRIVLRTWDYNIIKNLSEPIKSLDDSNIDFQNSGVSFFEGGLLLYVTIISVAANLATIADILYKYLKKTKTLSRQTRVYLRIGKDKELDISELPVDMIEKVLKLSLKSSITQKKRKQKKKL